MVVTLGKKHATLTSREITHPHMVKMTPLETRGHCVDSVTLEPLIHKESKTLIWINARD